MNSAKQRHQNNKLRTQTRNNYDTKFLSFFLSSFSEGYLSDDWTGRTPLYSNVSSGKLIRLVSGQGDHHFIKMLLLLHPLSFSPWKGYSFSEMDRGSTTLHKCFNYRLCQNVSTTDCVRGFQLQTVSERFNYRLCQNVSAIGCVRMFQLYAVSECFKYRLCQNVSSIDCQNVSTIDRVTTFQLYIVSECFNHRLCQNVSTTDRVRMFQL